MSLLLQQIFAHASDDNKQPAFLDEQGSYSFASIYALTKKLATGLASLDVAVGDRMLIAPLPTKWAIALTYAAWWVGLVVVPVPPRFLRDNQEVLLNELEAKVLVADTAVLERLLENDEFECPPLLLRPPKRGLSGWWTRDNRIISLPSLAKKSHPPGMSQAQDMLVYLPLHLEQPFVLYQEKSLLSQLAQLQSTLGNELSSMAQQKVLACIPLWHSFGFLAHVLLLPCVGVASYLPKRFDDQHLVSLHNKHEFYAITAFTKRISASLMDNLPGMKLLFMSGSYLSKLERKAITPSIQIIAAYGMRESGPAFALSQANEIPLKPLSDADFDIQSAQGHSLAIGEVGSLVIRGPQLMTGYWRRPKASRVLYQDNWLQTGDIARRYGPDSFAVLGRACDCFQIAGDWVIAPVMERQLMQALPIKQAKVEPTKMNELTVVRLTVVGEAVNISDIETYCRLHFAGHLVPKIVDVVDEIETDMLGNVVRVGTNQTVEVVQ